MSQERREPTAEKVLRLADAGDDRSAWITLLTTEHYNLQTQRAATIGEANGRASIFLGAVSAGLITLGFQSSGGGHSGASTTFQVLVLTSLAFLGLVTFLRCLEISIDDWQFSRRVGRLRGIYGQLVPDLADLLRSAAGAEQASAMLTRRRQPFQMLLSVAGTTGIIASIIVGADVGVLVHGFGGPLLAAVLGGSAAAAAAAWATFRFQGARWRGATGDPAGGTFSLGEPA